MHCNALEFLSQLRNLPETPRQHHCCNSCPLHAAVGSALGFLATTFFRAKPSKLTTRLRLCFRSCLQGGCFFAQLCHSGLGDRPDTASGTTVVERNVCLGRANGHFKLELAVGDGDSEAQHLPGAVSCKPCTELSQHMIGLLLLDAHWHKSTFLHGHAHRHTASARS